MASGKHSVFVSPAASSTSCCVVASETSGGRFDRELSLDRSIQAIVQSDRQGGVLGSHQGLEIPRQNFNRSFAGDLRLGQPLGRGLGTLGAGNVRREDAHGELDGLLANVGRIATQVVESQQAIGVVDDHLAARGAIDLMPKPIPCIRRTDAHQLPKDHQRALGSSSFPN